jgi:hypothetical protein
VIRTLSVLALAAAAVLGPGVAHASVGPVAQAPGCEVESASLDWGFKESFRGYIDGSIANGEWTVADGATYETPSFGFPADDGRVDPRAPNGSVDFVGTVRFTGHGGILDTTIGNPVLVFQGTDDAVLLLDVAGATMEGDAVEVTEARFVTVDLTGQDLTPVDGIVTIVAAPTALTVEGEEAFPNYPAGEAFDPISATIDLGDCDLTGQPIGTDTVDGGDGVIGDATPWVLLVIVLAAVLVILVTILFVGRLRR